MEQSKKELIREVLAVMNDQAAVLMAKHEYQNAAYVCQLAEKLHEWKHEDQA